MRELAFGCQMACAGIYAGPHGGSLFLAFAFAGLPANTSGFYSPAIALFPGAGGGLLASVSVVPEPLTSALLLFGLLAMGGLVRARQRPASPQTLASGAPGRPFEIQPGLGAPR